MYNYVEKFGSSIEILVDISPRQYRSTMHFLPEPITAVIV